MTDILWDGNQTTQQYFEIFPPNVNMEMDFRNFSFGLKVTCTTGKISPFNEKNK